MPAGTLAEKPGTSRAGMPAWSSVVPSARAARGAEARRHRARFLRTAGGLAHYLRKIHLGGSAESHVEGRDAGLVQRGAFGTGGQGAGREGAGHDEAGGDIISARYTLADLPSRMIWQAQETRR
jgi:hypothetical protein